MTAIRIITNEEILITIIWIMILSILFILAFLLPSIKSIIHKAYHKGYNEHRKDKINYYETLREIDNDYTSLMKEIKEKDIGFDIYFIENLIDLGNKIRKFKNNN